MKEDECCYSPCFKDLKTDTQWILAWYPNASIDSPIILHLISKNHKNIGMQHIVEKKQIYCKQLKNALKKGKIDICNALFYRQQRCLTFI